MNSNSLQEQRQMFCSNYEQQDENSTGKVLTSIDMSE